MIFFTDLQAPEFEIMVREREPPDLQATYNTAIRLETLKKDSSSKEAEPATTWKNVIRSSKATRAVQELSDHVNLEAVKEEILKQMSEWKIEKQREIDALRADNELLRQSGQRKPLDLAAVLASGWARAAIPADGVKRDYNGVTCYTCGQNSHASTVCRKKGAHKAAPTADGAKERTQPEERTCYICGKKDHLFRNCRRRYRQSPKRPRNRQRATRPVHVARWSITPRRRPW